MTKYEELKKLREQLQIEVKGIENYPLDEPNLVVSNHNCLMDIFYVPMIIPQNIVSLVSSRLIYKNDYDRKKVVNKYLNSMPIEAHGGRIYSSMCLSYAVKLLCEGISLNIFPEGAYVDENIIYRGRTGASRILYEAKKQGTSANLIPVAIDIDSSTINMDSYNPLECKIGISILKPVKYDDSFYQYINTEDRDEKNIFLHEPIDECMQLIAQTLKRQYVNEYIKLRPKNNVIFSDGTTIDINDAQNMYSICKYMEGLEKQKSKILKIIK